MSFPRHHIFAAGALMLSFPALAADDDADMATRFGNTVFVHESLGTSHLWFAEDHTFTAGNWMMSVTGTWDVKDGQICLHYDSTPPLHPNPECGPVAARQVGDKWEQDGRSFELVPGLQK